MQNVDWKYVKKLTNESAVKDFEEKFQMTLPDDLKQCIKAHNGGRPSKNIFDTEKTKERVFKTLLSFNDTDVENIYKYFPIIRRVSKSLIPFASDPSGNFLCVRDGRIVLYLHETDEIEEIKADSFSDFLGKLYD
jgi:hypothetical protein